MLDGPTKWLTLGREADVLKATREGDACKIMIAYAKEQGNSKLT